MIKENLNIVKATVPSDVTLIAVSKTKPVALGIGAASFASGDGCWSRKRMLESDAEFGSETVSE